MKLSLLLLSIILLLTGAARSASAADQFLTLCWHEITDGQTGNTFSVTATQLAQQLDWLKQNGYQSITLADIAAARAGRKTLPEKAILLTFDDGLVSFPQLVFPLLKSHNFHGVFAIVGKWTEDGVFNQYEPTGKPQAQMASWKEIHELQASGLVEVESHTYDLHHGELFNPQGNEGPAAAFFKYDPASRSYESDTDFSTRINSDMDKTMEMFRANLGRRPLAMVWPYGDTNTLASKAAERHGIHLQLTLDEGPTRLRDLPYIHRSLVMGDMKLSDFAALVNRDLRSAEVIRSARVSLDGIYRADPNETERLLGVLIERLRAEGVTTVFLESFSRDADGKIRSVYYPNSQLPMKADLFGRASHQFITRARVFNVFAVFPMSGYQNPAGGHGEPAVAELAAGVARNSDFNGLLVEGRSLTTKLSAVASGLHRYQPFATIWKTVDGKVALGKKETDWKKTFGGLEGVVMRLSANQGPGGYASSWLPILRDHLVVELPLQVDGGCEKTRALPELETQFQSWEDAGFRELGFRSESGCENAPDAAAIRQTFASLHAPLHPKAKAPILERNNR